MLPFSDASQPSLKRQENSSKFFMESPILSGCAPKVLRVRVLLTQLFLRKPLEFPLSYVLAAGNWSSDATRESPDKAPVGVGVS